MDYRKIYDDLINKAKVREVPEGYSERHHIVPRSLGGSDASENLVNLTAREHFVAHALLVKFTTGAARYKMANALCHLCQNLSRHRKEGHIPNSRLFEMAKKEHSLAVSKRMMGNTYTKGMTFSAEITKKKTLHLKGNKHAKGLVHSEESKRKMSIKRSGLKNARSKIYVLTSPLGKIYVVYACLSEFSAEFNLSLSMLNRNIDKGVIKINFTKSKKTEKSLNTHDWAIEELKNGR